MGACASKFKEFKDGVPPPAEKEEVVAAEKDVKIVEATAKEVKLVEETFSKDEVPAAAEDGEAKPRSLGHLLKEIEGEKGSTENGNATSPEPFVADAEAKGKAEKAPLATDDVSPSNPVEKKAEVDAKPYCENVGVEVSEKKTEEKSLAETENMKTEEEPTETTKLETPTETIKHEVKNAEVEKKIEDNKLAEDTKIETEACEKITEENSLAETEKKKTEEEPTEITKLETPTETLKLEAKNAEVEKKIEDEKLAEDTKIETPIKVEEDDKHIVEPTKIETCGEQQRTEVKTDENKPFSDAEKPKDGKDEPKN